MNSRSPPAAGLRGASAWWVLNIGTSRSLCERRESGKGNKKQAKHPKPKGIYLQLDNEETVCQSVLDVHMF